MKLIIYLFPILWMVSLQAQYTPPANSNTKANYRLWMNTKIFLHEYLDLQTSNPNNEVGKSILSRKLDFQKSTLLALKEQSVVISINGKNPSTVEIPIDHIEVFKFRKNGNKTLGLLAGAAAGLVAGIILEPKKEVVCHEINFWSGIFGTPPTVSCFETKKDFSPYVLVGGLVGMTIGSLKKTFVINGEQASYDQQREKLEKYLLVQ